MSQRSRLFPFVAGGFLLGALAGLLRVDDAESAVYHAGPGQPETVSSANAKMQPGDVCVLHAGTHNALPNPAAAATGGKRFTFQGDCPAGDTVARAGIILPGGTISKPYVTLARVSINGGLTLSETADRDSIIDVTATGSSDNAGADYTVWVRSKFKGPTRTLNKGVLGASDGVEMWYCDWPYLGVGKTGGDHIDLTWDADSTVEVGCRKLITVEAGLPTSLGAEWHFGDRNRTSRDNETRIHLKRDCYAIWRWRSNKDWQDDRGCFNNTFTNDRIIVTGVGGVIMPTSSASCGSGGYLAQCVGAWNWTVTNTVIDASACTGPSTIYWQGGLHGMRFSNCTLAANGPAIEAFDIHDQSAFIDCTIRGAVKFTTEYTRPLWQAGDMTFCRNALTGSLSIAPALAAVPGAFVTTCSEPPPPPTPTPPTTPPTPPAPTPVPDTVRVHVAITSKVPVVITSSTVRP